MKVPQMQLAHPIAVPLEADHVESPVVRFGDPFTAVFFLIEPFNFVVGPSEEQQKPAWGRITFEGLDSIRCSQGEHMPYACEEYAAWVYEVSDSDWLIERHEYESKHYQTPLLDEYHHYLFCFHDEFVEAIAKGIWLEPTGPEMSDDVAEDHPLNPLSVDLPAERFVLHRLHCELRKNPLPLAEIVEASKLCSQKLFQFFLTLEGKRSESYAALLRTHNGRSKTRMGACWPHRKGVAVDGVAEVADMMPAWEAYIREVAERRKEMGKND